jgi:hypothetical protein
MKKISEKLRYDGATLDQVSTMLGDKAFREEVCDRQRVTGKDVSIEAAGAGKNVRISMTQPVAGLPGFVKKFAGDSVEIVQSEQWRDAAQGDVVVEIPGKPGQMRGTARLVEEDGGVTELVDMEIKVNIPLVGGKIEGFIAEMLTKALRAENSVGKEYLARS